jgi:hypothetical protein
VVLVAGGGIGITQLVRNQQDASPSSVAADSAGTSAGSTTAGTSGGSGVPAAPESVAPSLGSTLGGIESALPAFTTAGFAQQAASFESSAATFDTLKNGTEYSQKDATRGATGGTSGSTGSSTGRVPDVHAAPTPTPTKALALPGSAAGLGAASSPLPQACPGPDLPETTSVQITFDGAPAVLVQHTAQGGSQVVQAWSCDGSAELATTSVRR